MNLLPRHFLGVGLFVVGSCGSVFNSPVAAQQDKQASKETSSPSASPATKDAKENVEAISAQAKENTKSQADPSSYRIGVEDDLQISVWKEPDLSITVVVRPDGMVTMPLVNDVHVAGLTPIELQALLTEKLKPYINEPQVTVIVRGIKSRKVYLYGQVGRGGAYPLIASKTVLELLAEAGGLTPFAKRGSIYVLREVDHKQVKIPFNYNNALKGKKPSDNFELSPGDIVVVP